MMKSMLSVLLSEHFLSFIAGLKWSEVSTTIGVPLTAVVVAYSGRHKSKVERVKLAAETAAIAAEARDTAMRTTEKAMRILEEALKYQSEQISINRDRLHEIEKQHGQCLAKLFEHEKELIKIKMTLGNHD